MTVLKCRSAGIKVIMITEDEAPKATAIATEAKILTESGTESVIDGETLQRNAYHPGQNFL